MGDLPVAPEPDGSRPKPSATAGLFFLAAAKADERTVDVGVVVIASDFHLMRGIDFL